MVQCLTHYASKAFGHKIAGLGIEIISKFETNQDFGLQILQSAIQNLQLDLSVIPKNLHEDLYFDILNVLEHRFFLYKNSNFACQVLNNLLELITHLKLNKLSFSLIPYTLRHQLYFHLHNLTELKLLEIKSVIMISIENIQDVEKLLLKALKHLRHLQKLTLYSYFTDNIMEIVTKYCTNIWYLNAKFSKLVTNESVVFLLNCKQLKEVILTHTSVTKFGYVDLILGRPSLTNVATNEDMNEIISLIANSSVCSHNYSFNIMTLNISNVQMKHVNFISKCCLNLRSLSVSCDDADFSVLSNLKYLEEIVITKADFKVNGIDFLLKNVGKKIQVLRMYRIDDVDLIGVNEFCPNLKTLLLDGCTFRNRNVIETKSDLFFPQLEHITCGENVPKSYLEMLLFNCKNVKCLYIADIGENLTDQNLRVLLQRNCLTCLEELCIYRCKCLTIKSVELLLSHCKQLKKFYGLERFAAISSVELKNFITKNRHLKVFTLEGPLFLQERFKLPW